MKKLFYWLTRPFVWFFEFVTFALSSGGEGIAGLISFFILAGALIWGILELVEKHPQEEFSASTVNVTVSGQRWKHVGFYTYSPMIKLTNNSNKTVSVIISSRVYDLTVKDLVYQQFEMFSLKPKEAIQINTDNCGEDPVFDVLSKSDQGTAEKFRLWEVK